MEVELISQDQQPKKKATSDGGPSSDLKRLISELILEKVALKEISLWGTCLNPLGIELAKFAATF